MTYSLATCAFCEHGAVVRDAITGQYACENHARLYGPCSGAKPQKNVCPCVLITGHWGLCECQHGVKIYGLV